MPNLPAVLPPCHYGRLAELRRACPSTRLDADAHPSPWPQAPQGHGAILFSPALCLTTMKSTPFRVLFTALCLLASFSLSSCTHHPSPISASDVVPNDKPFLWKVEGNGHTAWLFGTMHVSDPRVTTLHPVVLDTFAKANYLATELDESPSNGALLAQEGMLPAGQTLESMVGSEMTESIHAYLKSRSMDNDHIDRLRPWMVALNLAQIDAMPLLAHGQPLDLLLRKRAREQGMEVGQVETIEEQIKVLAWGEEDDHVHLLGITLEKLLEEQASGESSLHHLLDLYLKGDGEAMWAFALSQTDFEDPRQVGAWQALTTDRNRRMAQRIHQGLEENPQSKRFYAFGTLHFLGPESVIARLEDRGYTITRVTAPPQSAAVANGEDSK